MDIKSNKFKTITISILLFIAILVTIDLAYIYYEANFDAYAFPSFCSINELIDCDGVARTVESQFLGVPLAYWGLFLYSFITMLLAVDFLKKIPFLKFLEVFKNKFCYIASLGIISFSISMLLLCVSLFEIHKICIMCAITYILNLAIALIAVQGIELGFIGAIRQSWRDFTDALKPMPYRVAFIIVMTCALSFLGWTFTSAKFSPALKYDRNNGEFIKAKINKYAITGNVLGSKDKNAVVVNIYSDYQCPICSVYNIMIHKAAKQLDNIKFVHHSFPLDRECNSYLTRDFHHGSCITAYYAEAAQKQDKFWDVHSLFFEKKPATEEEILQVLEASKINLDMDKLKKDAHSKEVYDAVQKDIKKAVENKQLGTPLMEINGVFTMGIPNNGYPGLKEMLIRNGAKPKHKFMF